MISDTQAGEPVFSTAVSMSDCLKFQYALCKDLSSELGEIWVKSGEPIRKMIREGKSGPVEGLDLAASFGMANLASRVGMTSLNCVLFTCFSLESYINAFLFFLLDRKFPDGAQRDAEFSKINNKESTLSKLNKCIEVTGGTVIPQGDAIYETFELIFEFRNSIAHGKPSYVHETKGRVEPVFRGDEWAKAQENKSPLPEMYLHYGDLNLAHAFWATNFRDRVILELHERSNVEVESYHRHYSLFIHDNPEEESARVIEILKNARPY